jgi:4-amino-4-deoxy-L-arabinose transferase-like glycosyltransferase
LRFLSFWLLLVVVAIAVHLGGFPLLDADEGRNAEVGREMSETNDYVMPRLNGLPYLDKPVVYFAAEAAMMEVLGPTELAARLPAFLFTLATAAVLFWYARRLWGSETAYVAAIVFLTIPLTVAFSRTVIFDSALAFFVTVALCAFHLAIEGKNARWSILAWAAIGFAMITKGPVTFLLVLLVAIPFAWRRKAAGVLFPILGIVAFVAIVAPWVWGVTQVVPEFLRYVMVTETVERMATKALKRTGPPWYFLPYFLAGALPWSIVALFSWKKFRKPDPATVYWLLAFFIPFIFFSLNQSKRPQYIVPLMAPVALLVARIWPEAKTRAAAILVSVFGVVLLLAPLAFHRTKMKPEIAAVADETALALGIAFTIAGAVALFVKRREILLAALTVPMLVLPLAANPLLNALGERRSTRSFVAEMQPHLTPSTQIIGVEAFTGSLAFYSRRPIIVVTEDASELTSNYLIRRYEKYTSNPASPLKTLPYFEQSLASNAPRIYVLRNKDTQRRAALEARGWRVIADQAHLVAYGR